MLSLKRHLKYKRDIVFAEVHRRRGVVIKDHSPKRMRKPMILQDQKIVSHLDKNHIANGVEDKHNSDLAFTNATKGRVIL